MAVNDTRNSRSISDEVVLCDASPAPLPLPMMLIEEQTDEEAAVTDPTISAAVLVSVASGTATMITSSNSKSELATTTTISKSLESPSFHKNDNRKNNNSNLKNQQDNNNNNHKNNKRSQRSLAVAEGAGMAFLVVLVLSVIVIPVVFLLTRGDTESSFDDTNLRQQQQPQHQQQQNQPQQSQPQHRIEDNDPLLQMLNLSHPASLEALHNDPDSPQHLAYDWVSQDPSLDTYEPWRIRQRFGLAVFYYSFNGWGWNEWESSNWLSYYIDECSWFRTQRPTTTCHTDHDGGGGGGRIKVLNMTFQSYGFEGTIPPEFAMLDTLEILDFSHTDLEQTLSGLLPDPSALPASLKEFHCSHCRLHGSIPSYLFTTTTTTASTTTTTTTGVTQLRSIHWDNNDLTGTIPSELGLVSSLVQLDLSYNTLTSSIPSELGDLSQLQVLELRHNQLWGTIPASLFVVNDSNNNSTALMKLDVQGNSEIQEEIPEDLCTRRDRMLSLSPLDLSTDWCHGEEECCRHQQS